MDLNELQQQRKEWVAQNFGTPESDRYNLNLIESALGVVEEVGELAHSILKRGQLIRGSRAQHSSDIRDAIGDIVVFLAGVAEAEGLQLGDVVEEVWQEVVERNWVANPQDGKARIGGPPPSPPYSAPVLPPVVSMSPQICPGCSSSLIFTTEQEHIVMHVCRTCGLEWSPALRVDQ